MSNIEQAALDVVQGVITGALVDAGVSPAIAAFVAKSVPALVELAESSFAGGGDAQRKAMLDQVDVAVDAAEREKFGG